MGAAGRDRRRDDLLGAGGAAMPNLLRLMRFDPRVAAGPIALASADVVTILIYFNLARLLLK